MEIRKIERNHQFTWIQKEWYKTLTRPEDGMWHSFRELAQPWGIWEEDLLIGYGIVNSEFCLIQFFMLSDYLMEKGLFLKKLIEEAHVSSILVGTNNPVFLSAAAPLLKHSKIHTYLFDEYKIVTPFERPGTFKKAKPVDLERLIKFCQESTGGPESWLRTYLEGLIQREEIYFLELEGKIVGTSEVRKNPSSPDFADLGMIVHPDFRKKGYGTDLLLRGKIIANEKGMEAICSCEASNDASFKTISNCGFVSFHSLLFSEI
ncbi:MAG: GNAT family N-acetyltransferase [Saprospiraceae bacterium]